MRCDELNRWLDEGAPETGGAAARAHAAGCADCARTIAAFEALESALAAPAPAPPNAASFTARVMERIERPATSAAPAPSRPAPVPWWLALLSEPAFAVALVAALLLVTTPAALRMEAGRSLLLPVAIASDTLAAQFARAAQAWLAPLAVLARFSPLERLYLFLGFAPLFVWAGLWIYRSVERLVRGAPARRG